MSKFGAIIGGVIGGVIGAVCGGNVPLGAALGAGIGAACGNEEKNNVDNVGDNTNEDTNPLSLNIIRKKITLDDSTEKIDVFEIQIKGVVFAPRNNTDVKCILVPRDCTGGKTFEDADVIYTQDNDFSSIGSNILSPAEEITLPYEATEWEEWVTLFTIPIDCFVFPYRGSRELEFCLLIEDKKEKVLAFSSAKTTVRVREIGFIDIINLWPKAEKLALKIIHVLVFNNSKYFTIETSKIIKDWIDSRVELRDEASEKNEIRQSLNNQFTKIKNSASDAPVSSVASFAKDLSGSVSISDKYSFMELFLKVVSSFENISTDDFELLDLLSREMGLDDKEYQEAKHKFLPIHETESADPFVTLGIPHNISTQEKARKLRELYAKWNALTTHKNPEMRRKAEKMLAIITECRKQI